jgi:hypothetical protein
LEGEGEPETCFFFRRGVSSLELDWDERWREGRGLHGSKEREDWIWIWIGG